MPSVLLCLRRVAEPRGCAAAEVLVARQQLRVHRLRPRPVPRPGVLAAVQDPVGAADLADGEYCQVAAGVKLLLVTMFLSPPELEPLHGVDDWSCVDLDKWSILLEVIQQETGTPELGYNQTDGVHISTQEPST